MKWYFSNSETEKPGSVGGYVEIDPDITDLSSDLVLQLADDVKSSGAKLQLLVVPSKFRIVNGIYGDKCVILFHVKQNLFKPFKFFGIITETKLYLF